MNECRRLCGEMRLSIPARFTNRLTIRSNHYRQQIRPTIDAALAHNDIL